MGGSYLTLRRNYTIGPSSPSTTYSATSSHVCLPSPTQLPHPQILSKTHNLEVPIREGSVPTHLTHIFTPFIKVSNSNNPPKEFRPTT